MKEQNLESKSSYEKLFYDHLYLVEILIKKFKYSYLDRDDLRQAGLMGLFQAALHFDKNKNVLFSTYATYYVIGEIKKEIRNNRLLKLNEKINKIKVLLNSNNTIEEISNQTGYSKELINEALISSDRIVYLEDQNNCNNPIVSNNNDFYEQLKQRIEEISQSNDKKIQRIAFVLYLRYFEKLTQKEIGKRLNLSQSQVSRLLIVGKKII